MKKIYVLFLFCTFSYSQILIGNDIDGDIGDSSGYSVSLSSNGAIVAVGSPFNSENGSISGLVRVYESVSGVWTQIGNDINGENGEFSGCNVSISSDGSIVAIGSIYYNENLSNCGRVRVFKYLSGIWTQIGNSIIGQAPYEYFGYRVSLSSDGSIIAVGTPTSNGSSTAPGKVRIYKNELGLWYQIGDDINGEHPGDRNGESISLSEDGSIVAIGAIFNDNNGFISGQARIFKNNSGSWSQIGSSILGANAYDTCGSSVSLSDDGTVVAIGSNSNSSNGAVSGNVRIFKNYSGIWIQIGSDINGEAVSDYSGSSVSLSGDGTIVAIGALGNDGNGNQSGHVRIFKYNSDLDWIQVGTDIDGEFPEDRSGYSISLNSTGNTLAIGAIYNGKNGSNSGQVRVYDLSSILSSETYSLDNFMIYPNPTSNQITINLQNSITFNNAIIYNNLGQVLKNETSNVIDVKNLSQGTYFIEVITDKGKVIKSFIKK